MKTSEVVPRPIINCKLNRILDILDCCLAVQSDFLDYSQNIIEATETLTLEIVFYSRCKPQSQAEVLGLVIYKLMEIYYDY